MARHPALPLVGLLLLGVPLTTAAPAWAAGSLVAPGAGVVYAEDTVVRVEAEVAAGSTATQLRLVDPSGVARTVGTASPSLSAQTLRHALDTACPEYPGTACAGRRPAPNGTWTVQLSGGATDSRTFVLRIPPRAPGEVRVEATGPREVVVTWPRGPEPDLRGHVVVDGEGRVLAEVDDDCPTGTCRAVVRYDSDGPATSAVAVRAVRAVCPGCEESLSAMSGAVPVSRPGRTVEPAPGGAAPEGAGQVGGDGSPGGRAGGSGDGSTGDSGDGSAQPTGEATSGAGGSGTGTGGTGTGTGGTGTGGTGTGGTSTGGPGTTGGRPTGTPAPGGGSGSSGDVVLGAPAPQTAADAFALSFKAFGPKIGLPKLPPLPATGVALPDVAPAEDGGFSQALPFQEQVVEEQVASGPVARVGGAVSTAVGTAVDSERFARSLAAAMLLLLGGAHVRLWLGRVPAEP